MRSRWINPGHENTSVLTIHRFDESAGRLALQLANAGLIYHRLLGDGRIIGELVWYVNPPGGFFRLSQPLLWLRHQGGQSRGGSCYITAVGSRRYPAT